MAINPRMRMACSGLAATALALALGAVGAQESHGDAALGKELFYAHGCYGCHGFNGETGARDLVGTGSPIVSDEATFLLFLRLRADQAPELPSTSMPNFSVEALSDAEARDIFAYIRTFRLDAPRIEDVATLREILESAEASAP
jgi:mono/diheme cytochrome c family protein